MTEEQLKNIRERIEEIGEVHNKNCGVFLEDACDCDNVRAIIKIISEVNGSLITDI